jgi:hypothetical protein
VRNLGHFGLALKRHTVTIDIVMLRRVLDSICNQPSACHNGQDARRVANILPVSKLNQPLRLNLGCGDKLLPGYVNVDVAPTRGGNGNEPDVVCDIRSLKDFADDSVDEVLAVHVVEHFWRWEVVGILCEWARVLKRGGRMVLECPNLLTACEELLKNPLTAARSGREGQRTMWVLYGDPAWQDPLMCHRWNYTPASLEEVMQEAGIANIRQEPAQFKLREPRDFRLVGEKLSNGHRKHHVD